MTNDLIALATEINAAHEAACQSAQSALEHARRAGDLLIQAKAAREHGEWLPWLAEHCPTVSPRAAQGYMRIAREWPTLQDAANAKRVSYLPVREALALLAAPSETPEDADRAAWLDTLTDEQRRLVEQMFRNHHKLLGLIWYLTWNENSHTARGRRALHHCIEAFEEIGWDARDLASYCKAMPEFGREECAAWLREDCESRIAKLAPVSVTHA